MTIRIIIAVLCVFAMTYTVRAQNSKLDGPFLTKRVIKVSGDCELCKTGIEKAARRTPGVTFAHWDVDSQKLLVEYNRAKTNPEKIQQMIAAYGYDTEKFKASDTAYVKRAGCCPGRTGGK